MANTSWSWPAMDRNASYDGTPPGTMPNAEGPLSRIAGAARQNGREAGP